MSPRRGARARSRFQHFSISATDAEWEVVRANAARGRVSMARYLVELGLAEERAEKAEPSPALAPGEARAVNEAVRELASLVGIGTGARTLVEEMHHLVGGLVDAWASEMEREGRLGEVRAILTGRVGASKAEEVLARIAATPAARSARSPEPRDAEGTSPSQGTLNLRAP